MTPRPERWQRTDVVSRLDGCLIPGGVSSGERPSWVGRAALRKLSDGKWLATISVRSVVTTVTDGGPGGLTREEAEAFIVDSAERAGVHFEELHAPSRA